VNLDEYPYRLLNGHVAPNKVVNKDISVDLFCFLVPQFDCLPQLFEAS
jgi:hypothetical protein